MNAQLKSHQNGPRHSFRHDLVGDRIAVDVTPESITTGGIIVPESVKSDGQSGTILGIGEEVKNSHLLLGSEILFGRFSGTPFKLDNRQIKIIREEDVLLVLRSPENG